jgi:DNA adenine methylase
MGSFQGSPDFIVHERLKAAQVALAKAEIRCCDFVVACKEAKSGDTVFLDPPYTVAHANNGFLRYNEGIFTWKDQERLAQAARRLDVVGCKVVITNADHPSIRSLYKGFHMKSVSRRSLVASKASKRRLVSELVITNFRQA